MEYRFIDMTSQAEPLFQFIDLTIDTELASELAHLAGCVDSGLSRHVRDTGVPEPLCSWYDCESQAYTISQILLDTLFLFM